MKKNKKNTLDNLSIMADRIGSNTYLQSISQGVMGSLPFIIIGAFASLLVGLRIEAWQNFIDSIGIRESLSMVVQATTNSLGMIVTFFVASSFSEKLELKSKIIGFLAVVSYLILQPSNVLENGTNYLAFDYLGTQGMFLGILIALVTVRIFKFTIDHNILVKMPDSTPPFVQASFSALIPGLIIAFTALLTRHLFSLTQYQDAFSFIYGILQAPIQNLVVSNIWAIAAIGVLINLVFSIGIHPGFIQGLMAPFLFSLDGMNQAAYASGEDLPNTIGMAWSYTSTIVIFLPAFVLAVLLFSKSKQLKTVGKVSLVPSFFGISEPLVFGVPVVFNPIIIIPYVLIPAINQIISYYLIELGIVSRFIGATVFNIPIVFSGLLNGSISIVIMQIGLLILDIILLMPFIKIYDRKILNVEKEAEIANQNVENSKIVSSQA